MNNVDQEVSKLENGAWLRAIIDDARERTKSKSAFKPKISLSYTVGVDEVLSLAKSGIGHHYGVLDNKITHSMTIRDGVHICFESEEVETEVMWRRKKTA